MALLIVAILGSCLFCFAQLSASDTTAAAAQGSQDQSLILEKLLENYDERLRPKSDGPPVVVACNSDISSFGSVTETTMDYSVTMYFRQMWNDPRLSFDWFDNETDVITVSSKVREKMWIPDLFFVNVKEAFFHTVTMDNVLLRIYSNGDILYSSRLSLRLGCQMSLENFPLDSQVCSIIIESYGYSSNELELYWSSGNSSVKIYENIELPQFTITDVKVTKLKEIFVTGDFDKLQVDFYLTRELGYYILQTFVPSTLLVVLSWVSFLIDPNAAPARVALGITTVLTLTTQGSGVKADLPKVAYAKAIDVWMAVCLVFVFGALVEFSMVNYLNTNRKRKEQLKKENQIYATVPMQEFNANEEKVSEIVKIPENTKPSSKFNCSLASDDAAHICDRLSLILFPIVFMIFNLVFWTYYL